MKNGLDEDRTEEFQIQHDASALLEKIQNEVSNRDYTILVKRYGLDGDTPLTLSEVADKYEITRARVHQIEHKLLTKMRAMVS